MKRLPPPGYQSPAEAAERLGVSVGGVTSAAREGLIPGCVRLGGRWMIPESWTPTMIYEDAYTVSGRWECSERLVTRLCRQGRVVGARYLMGRWHIPAGARKPAARG